MKFSVLSTALSTILFTTVFASNGTEVAIDTASTSVAQAVAKLQKDPASSEYKAGAAELRQLAGEGNIEAMVKLGEVLEEGTGVNDFEYAIASYRQAAQAGYAPAEELIAKAYLNRGLDAGPRTALGREFLTRAAEAYKALAERDSPDALWNLGYLLTSGYGVERDHNLGFTYITRASKLGSASASFWLANFYHANPGQDEPDALRHEYLQRAAGQGSHMALAMLEGKNEPAAALPSPSTDNGISPGRTEVAAVADSPLPSQSTADPIPSTQPTVVPEASSGPAYYEELDRTRNELRQARREIEQLQARLQNFELEKSDASMLNQEGLQAVMDNDYELAAVKFRQAAEHDHAGAIANLGTMHLNGTGVARDSRQAVALFERAVKLGNVTAAENLGRTYQYGLGVRKDRSRAIRWYMTAEDMGSAHATEALRALHDN